MYQGIGAIYAGVVLLLIVLFFEETMFDRHLDPIPEKPTTGMRYRVETLVVSLCDTSANERTLMRSPQGITAAKMSRYRPSVFQGVWDLVTLVWRPQCILPLFYVMLTFGFGIGINVTNAVFVASPPPLGFGFEGARCRQASYAMCLSAFREQASRQLLESYCGLYLGRNCRQIVGRAFRL